jgi:hypothetical protein
VGEMTTKPPSGLAASGTANDLDPEQVTKEQNEDGQDINVDPSEDVTVEATEDVTSEAASHTPPPQARPGTVGVSPGQRAPTLLGVPIQSLPLPGVTSASDNDDATRTIDYNEEVTVLAQPSSSDPIAVLDALDRPSFDDDLDQPSFSDGLDRPSITDDDEEETKDARPSITDDDEEETKVEPAEAAMKAAASIDDVSTALSAQASLEREKALRRSAPSLSPSDDLEFADPDADDDQDEDQRIHDELDDEDEIISAGGAIEEEEDDVGESGDGVATATFMKPADTTGLSGLLNPRRPPTGGRDGFGSRLPTPYPPPQSPIPGPSTSPFGSRLGPAPIGSPYAGRATGASMPAIQVPPPSGKATTETAPAFFAKQVPMVGVMLLCFGFFVAGFGIRGLGGKSAPTPAAVVTKPAAAPAAPAVVVEPVQNGQPAANPQAKPADTTAIAKPATPPGTEPPAGTTEPAGDNPEAGLWRPTKKPIATAKPHKPPVDMAADDGAGAATKPKPAIAKEPKPPAATVATKPAVPKEPKPTVTATAKPAKKPAKAWVDPFAN